MRNARKMDGDITVGRVPDADDLRQLKELGFRTLVDVRDEKEMFGGHVQQMAQRLGLDYSAIPIRRSNINIGDVIDFYRIVLDARNAPLYLFSRFGKKPLAFVLLLDAVVNGDPLVRVFQRARRIGIDLRGDLALQSFLVDFFNKGCTDEVMAVARELRPDLVRGPSRIEQPGSVSTASALDVPSRYVDRAERESLLGHTGSTVWLTGLPCAGKTTVAFALEWVLTELGFMSYVLDSDVVRPGFSADLGYTARDRAENVRRVAHMAKILADAGLIVITSFISPYKQGRAMARELHKEAGLKFLEVFVDTPIDVCKRRDVRGLYRQATRGDLSDFTGVSDPYEPPGAEAFIVRPAADEAGAIARQIVHHMFREGLLTRAAPTRLEHGTGLHGSRERAVSSD
jgi:uncharacterized protein (TIGR01244 family)